MSKDRLHDIEVIKLSTLVNKSVVFGPDIPVHTVKYPFE